MSTESCNEDTHPREWILFESIDVDGDHILQKEEVEAYFGKCGMCCRAPPVAVVAASPASMRWRVLRFRSG